MFVEQYINSKHQQLVCESKGYILKEKGHRLPIVRPADSFSENCTNVNYLSAGERREYGTTPTTHGHTYITQIRPHYRGTPSYRHIRITQTHVHHTDIPTSHKHTYITQTHPHHTDTPTSNRHTHLYLMTL